MAETPDLLELCRAAVDAAEGDEAVEAYGAESRHTEVRARDREVEGLTFSETRGVGVRIVAGGRLGYAYAADPSVEEVRAAAAAARENVTFGTPDEFNALPLPGSAEAMPSIFRDSQGAFGDGRRTTGYEIRPTTSCTGMPSPARSSRRRPASPRTRRGPTAGASSPRSQRRETRRRRGSTSASPARLASSTGRTAPPPRRSGRRGSSARRSRRQDACRSC